MKHSSEYLYDVLFFQSQLAHHRWLISFTFGDRSPASNEYKKLQAFLQKDHIQVPIPYKFFSMSFLFSLFCCSDFIFFQVSRVDCTADSKLCQSLYIYKPCIAVFKGLGIHDFEIHHGQYSRFQMICTVCFFGIGKSIFRNVFFFFFLVFLDQ